MEAKNSWRNLGDGEREQIYQRVLKGEDTQVVAEELGMKATTLSRRLREHRAQKMRPVITKTGDFSKHWKLLCKMIGRDPGKPLPAKRPPKKGTTRKVVVLCDLHGDPYWPLIKQVAQEKPDLIHFDGDLFDAHAFSRYPRKTSIPITDELARVRAVLEYFAEAGIEQWITEGNHDRRAFLYFADRIDVEYMPLVQWNLLELAAREIPDVRVISNRYDYRTTAGTVIEGRLENTWIAHIGDVISGHALIARKGDGRSVEAFAQWIEQWRAPLGWGDSPAVVIQAHVHGASVSYANGGHQIRVEGGFAGNVSVMQYAQEKTGARPPVPGYTVFEQRLDSETWKTDRGSVRFLPC